MRSKTYKVLVLTFFLGLFFSGTAFSQNTFTNSFSKTKSVLEDEIYLHDDERKTIYCDAQFFDDKSIELTEGFVTEKYVSRSKKIEWEHVVPASSFGNNFVEWTEGDPICVDSKGKSYKNRACAEKANEEYQLMQADMYNLYPAIGAVNATRSNYDFAMLPGEKSDFGICEVKVENKLVEPPVRSRGKIARAYIYMDVAYPKFDMPDEQLLLMFLWNEEYPVTADECERTKRIEEIQGNENTIVKKTMYKEKPLVESLFEFF